MSNRSQHWAGPLADLGQPPTSLERPSASQRQPAANWDHDPLSTNAPRAAVPQPCRVIPRPSDGDQYEPTRFHEQPTHSYAQPTHFYTQPAHSYAQPTQCHAQPTRFYAQPPGAMLPQSPHIVPPPSIPIALPPLSEIMRSRPPDPLSASLPLSVMPGVMSAPTSAAVAGLVVRAVTRHDIENPPQRRVVPPLQLRREEPQLGTEAAQLRAEAARPTEPRQHRAEDPSRRYADQPPSRHLEHAPHHVEHPPRHVEHPPRRREPKLWQIILPTSKILPEHMDLLTGIIRKRADLAVLAGPASPLHTVVFSPDIDLAGLLRFYRMALPESNQVFLAGSPLSSCQVYLGRDLCQKPINAHRLRDGDYDYHVKIGQRLCTWMQCRFSVSLHTEDKNAYLTLCAHVAARHFGQTPMCPLCRRVLRVPEDAEWEAYDLIKKHFMTGLCLELAKHAINRVAKPVPRPVLDADDGLAPLTTGSG